MFNLDLKELRVSAVLKFSNIWSIETEGCFSTFDSDYGPESRPDPEPPECSCWFLLNEKNSDLYWPQIILYFILWHKASQYKIHRTGLMWSTCLNNNLFFWLSLRPLKMFLQSLSQLRINPWTSFSISYWNIKCPKWLIWGHMA